MLSDKVRAFVSENHQGVLTTFRRSGSVQMSIITCGPYGDGVALTTTADRAKLVNLNRNPRCSLLVSQGDWWGYVVLEGYAKVMSSDNTDADELRLALRQVYRAATGKEHPDWEEYDRAMVDQRRAVVLVVPEHIYGTATWVQHRSDSSVGADRRAPPLAYEAQASACELAAQRMAVPCGRYQYG